MLEARVSSRRTSLSLKACSRISASESRPMTWLPRLSGTITCALRASPGTTGAEPMRRSVPSQSWLTSSVRPVLTTSAPKPIRGRGATATRWPAEVW